MMHTVKTMKTYKKEKKPLIHISKTLNFLLLFPFSYNCWYEQTIFERLFVYQVIKSHNAPVLFSRNYLGICWQPCNTLQKMLHMQ